MSKQPSRRHRSGLINRLPATSRKQRGLDYSQLEARQLLATDLGLNLTGHTKGTQSDVVDPNMVGDIGPTHYIESIRDQISIFDRNTGNRTLFKTPQQFWIDIGGTVSSAITNTQVVFDRLANRWLMLGQGEGAGNWLYVAISDTPNPMQGWKSLRFVGDSNGVRLNGELSIAVDSDALLITTRNTSTVIGFPLSVSIYTIPKVDLYRASPTLTNMSRFENLSPAVYGDYLRPSFSYEASDGRAMVIGSRGPNNLTTVINNVGAAGATLGTPRLIDFDPSELFVDNNNFGLGAKPPNARQNSDLITIDPFFNISTPKTNASDVLSNPYDYNGGLWFVQGALVAYPAGIAHGIFWYEVDKNTNQLLQGGVVPTPVVTPTGEPGVNAWEWDMYNPSFSINNFGLLQINFTVSSEEYEVNPTAASSIAQTVKGLAIYNPIFDVIGYSNEEPGKESKNTQFERPFYIQEGLSLYRNNPGIVSSWSWRASTGWDPNNYNRFWASTQWSNTVSRWSTQVTELIPNNMTVQITGDENDNVFVLRRKAGSPELMEILIDGNVTDTLPYEPVGKLVLNGFDGDDILRVDYSNGNPVPLGGFEFNGMRGADRIETNNPAGSTFVVNSFYRNIYGGSGAGSGTYNGLSGFTGVEDLHGGDGPDTFEVTDVWQLTPFYIQQSQGFLAGSMVGNGGDDTFKFSETGWIGDSVDGGTGFNTISFQDRGAGGPLVRSDYPVAVQLTGPSVNGGYDGFTPVGLGFQLAIGDNPQQNGDQFRNINFIRGANTSFDDVRGINQQAFVFVDDENSFYEAGGARLGFFQINAISGSQFNDHFVGINNTVNPLQLNGLAGDDLYDFSSDAPTNQGSTAGLQNLLFAQGGSGNNVMNISNRGGSAVDALILQNRISGLGEIAYNAVGGTFALNVWASEFDDHIDLHSFFVTNTLNLHLLGGNDTMSIQDLSKATVNIFGGAGDDVYTVERIQGIDLRNLNIIDSVGSERDRVQLAGTILDETFTISQTSFADLNVSFVGIEWFGVETRGGNDIINVLDIDFELWVDAGDGNDIINISSNAPSNTGTVDAITRPVTVEGGAGRNELRIGNSSGVAKNVTINSSTITGLLPSTLTYLSTGGTFSLASGIGGILIQASNTGNDVFAIQGLNVDDSLRVVGNGGNDQFTVAASALGNIQIEGSAGADIFNVNYVGSGSRQVVVVDEGTLPATGRLNLNGTAGVDTIDVASARATRGSEQITIQGALAYWGIDLGLGSDNLNVGWSTNIAELEIMGNSGNDNINITSTSAATLLKAWGGTGDDNFTLGANVPSTTRLDGQAGTDRYTVRYQTSGSRSVDARDSGTLASENDVLTVIGTAAADNIEVRTNRVLRGTQTVTFDQNSERLIVQTVDGNDTINLYGSLAGTTQVQAGTGDDDITIHSTTGSAQTTIDGNDGTDTFLVLRTTVDTRTLLRGGNGDDRFNIGSTLEANSGNLGLIRGIVTAQGNASSALGEDRLYINDFNVNTPYNYNVTPTFIGALAGPNNVPRPQFAGIRLDETMEFARLDGTIAANFFNVRPSFSTRFYIDGNLPSPLVGSGDYIFLNGTSGDGRQLTITDAPRGRGFWSFTNGHKEVRFEEIETTNDGAVAPQNMPLVSSGGSSGSSSGFIPSQMRSSGGTLDSLAGSISLEDDDDIWVSTTTNNRTAADAAIVEIFGAWDGVA